MMNLLKNSWQAALVTAILALTALTTSVEIEAQNANANPRAFGIGQPRNVNDLPPGQLRKQLKALPNQTRGKALDRLRGFAFTEMDIPFLRVDKHGGIFYADIPPGPEEQQAAAQADVTLPEPIAAADTFFLHSRPGASRTVYLDFDGHEISGTWWNAGSETLYGTAYDPSNDDVVTTACVLDSVAPVVSVNFSASELAAIQEIWHRTAEDFAPWDINVTTEEPATFGPNTGRLLFSKDVDYCNRDMPSKGFGGVAYVNVFGQSYYPTLASPALVYWPNLGNGFAPFNHEAASHELGHNLGLAHDADAIAGLGYYGGHGNVSDLTSWAPIMGVGYYRHVTQWSEGNYPGYNDHNNYGNGLDDVSILTNKLTLRPDDHKDNNAEATALVVQGDGTIEVSDPEIDPYNVIDENKGIIHTRDDRDHFWFDTAAGAISFQIEPAWRSYNRGTRRRGANLDIEAALYRSDGTLVVRSEPTDHTQATINESVPAGRYFLVIDGVGKNGISYDPNNYDPDNLNYGYDDYGSLGMYFISGSVQPASADTTPPGPNPMTWAVEPYSSGVSSIGMTATTANDPTGPVEYRFSCVPVSANCGVSDWQINTSYTATGLDPDTSYTFVVVARDGANNLTDPSPQRSATTDLPPPNIPGNFSASSAGTTEIDLSWNDVSGETGYTLQRSPNGSNGWTTIASPGANSTTFDDSGLNIETTYWYRLRANNSEGSSAWTSTSATTDGVPPDGSPDGLIVTGVTTSSITLAWNDNSSNEASFQIQGSQTGTGGWSSIGSVGSNVTTFTENGLGSLETRFYRVIARNAQGDSAPSNVKEGTTGAECTSTLEVFDRVTRAFSLPCDPGDSMTVTDMITGVDVSRIQLDWSLFGIDNATKQLFPLAADSILVPGVFYIIIPNADATISVSGRFNQERNLSLTQYADENQVNGNWNFLGYTGASTLPWASVVPTNGTPQDWNWADRWRQNLRSHYCDLPMESQAFADNCRIRRVYQRWSGAAWEPYMPTSSNGDSAGTLQPWDAFIVQSFQPGLSLTIPQVAATAPEPETAIAVDEKPVKGNKSNGGNKGNSRDWRIRLIAQSGRLKDSGNVLGQLQVATDGLDPMDQEEFVAASNEFLTVLFDNPAFGPTQWGYTSDFRAATRNPSGEWAFSVRGSGTLGEVTLRWQGDKNAIERGTLINQETGEQVRTQPGGKFTFVMPSSGAARFIWRFE